jgi:hypothetical protein
VLSRKLAAFLGAPVVGIVLLSGCAQAGYEASGGDTAPGTGETIESVPREAVFEPDVAGYREVVSTAFAGLSQGTITPPSDIETVGFSICDAAERNETMLERNAQVTDARKAVLVTSVAMAAVRYLCPSHAAWLATEYPLSEPSAYEAALGAVLGVEMPTYEENPAPGNGYVVTCEDGTILYSGGIQGACSHHGGVAG